MSRVVLSVPVVPEHGACLCGRRSWAPCSRSLADEAGDENLGVEEVVAGGDDFGEGAGEGDLGVGAFEDAARKDF